MKVNMLTLKDPGYPETLRHADPAPKQIFWAGADPSGWLDRPRVAIVGSRRVSAYGRSVTQKLASELAASGVVIISGLALGIDSVAHQSALDAGGTTVAVLPTGLDRIYPPSHQNLANQIIKAGGTLLTEYTAKQPVFKYNFIERNRIVSALADVLLITEAALKSGTMHTARFALQQGKTVMAVPGNITSPGSEGCNNLIKSGALVATDASDIFFALGVKPAAMVKNPKTFHGSPEEKFVLELIAKGLGDQEAISAKSKLDGPTIASALTMLEIAGRVRPLGNGNWTLA